MRNKQITKETTNLPIPKDKALHAIVCALIAAFVSYVTGGLPGWNILLGIGAAMVVGIGKEIFDYFRGGTCSKDDLIADFLGAVIGALVGAGVGVI